MRLGAISQYFSGVVAKRLQAGEVMPTISNQHEFNGVRELRNLLGVERITNCPTHFIWLGEDNEVFAEPGVTTWYDARERHPTRTEYRLYFQANPVMDAARPGDLLLLARKGDGSLLAVVTLGGSTMEAQLLWLFDVPVSNGRELVYRDLSQNDSNLNFAQRYILEELGIEIDEPNSPDLDILLEPFGLQFPRTTIFSAFARETVFNVHPSEDPDAALLAWIEREEALFRRQEKRILASRLEDGFFSNGEADVDGFVNFSLSVHNRRKSRAGHALEHHLKEIFDRCGVRYSHGAFTEGMKRPDFLFPGADEYHDPDFPAESLVMLGAKSTCKDRWRQVLSEAARIPGKHLLTLEPSISLTQTSEMRASRLQLVVPAGLHITYQREQQDWLLTLSDFISIVKELRFSH